jgi:hypothetical protein
MSRFLIPVSRNWIGEEFYGSKYALHVAAPHVISPFLYVRCILFACGARPSCPRAANYTNSFMQALGSGSVDSDLVQYVEYFDRSTFGNSPGLRRKDENDLKIIRSMTPMQHRTMLYDAIKAAVFLHRVASDSVVADFVRDVLTRHTSTSNVSTNGENGVSEYHPYRRTANANGSKTAAEGKSSDKLSSSSSSAAATVGENAAGHMRSLRISRDLRAKGRKGHPDRQSVTPAAAGASNNSNSGADAVQQGGAGALQHAQGVATESVQQQQQKERISALECLRVIFSESEVKDLAELSRELGLPADVVIKAYEISLRERNIVQRKKAIFSPSSSSQ